MIFCNNFLHGLLLKKAKFPFIQLDHGGGCQSVVIINEYTVTVQCWELEQNMRVLLIVDLQVWIYDASWKVLRL